MDSEAPAIRPLPADVAGRIKSSVVITNLNGVIIELLKNSLDACASSVTIQVDFQKGACTVEDNGCGINPLEFSDGGSLGKLYHTSKFGESRPTYGGEGIFLSSLISLALVTITSRHTASQSTNSLVYHHSNAIARLCPAPIHHDLTESQHGTRVTVRNLFGNLPVRVKHRALALRKNEDLDKEWSDLKRDLTGLLIAFQIPFKLTVLDASKSRKLIFRGRNQPSFYPMPSFKSLDQQDVDIGRLRAILSQAGYIQPAEFSSWVTLSARSSDVSVQGAISLQPSPTKQVQFISFGINPAYQRGESDILFNEINRIFLASNFGTEEASFGRPEDFGIIDDEDEDGPTPMGSKRQNSRAKGVNRWPMFYIRITLYERNLAPGSKEDLFRSGVSVQRLIDIITAMLNQFLEQHNLSPQSKPRMKRSRDGSVSQLADRETNRLRRENGENPSTQDATERAESTDRSAKKHLQFNDFGNWSRIKSGRKGIYGDLCSGLPRGIGKSAQGNCSDRTGITRPSSAASAPVVMQPNVLRGESKTCSCLSDSPHTMHHDESALQVSFGDAQAPTDEAIPWTNPVTKDVVLINQRTGQTLPSAGGMAKSGKPSRLLPKTNSAAVVRHLNRISSEPACSKPTPWLDSLMETWENPVFRQSECSIRSMNPDILGNRDWHPTMGKCLQSIYSEGLHSDILDGQFTKFKGKLGKEALREGKVIAQVDNKFILIKMNSTPSHNEDIEEILVLVDQHAADERCRVEQLFGSLCGPSPSHTVETTTFTDPISFSISSQEAELFEARSGYFTSWGCHFDIVRDSEGKCGLVVTKLPTLIAERCRAEPKLSIDMLRSELWNRADSSETSKSTLSLPDIHDNGNSPRTPGNDDRPSTPNFWLHRIIDCPKKMVELLNSRACRSAIMFNDVLDLEECNELIIRVSKCVFPFQCAHGRPSMVPIMNLGPASHVSEPQPENVFNFSHAKMSRKGSTSNLDFVGAFNAWQRQTP